MYIVSYCHYPTKEYSSYSFDNNPEAQDFFDLLLDNNPLYNRQWISGSALCPVVVLLKNKAIVGFISITKLMS